MLQLYVCRYWLVGWYENNLTKRDRMSITTIMMRWHYVSVLSDLELELMNYLYIHFLLVVVIVAALAVVLCIVSRIVRHIHLMANRQTDRQTDRYSVEIYQFV